jgi:Na+-driven multidrug efflux pump
MQWRILRMGIPTGAQFLLTMLGLGITYRAVRPFGAEASAAVGVGFRVLQTALYPPLSVAAAAASLVGQNTGARLGSRVRQTLGWAVGAAIAICLAEWALLAAAPHYWVGLFAGAPGIVALGASYLLINGGGNALIAVGIMVTFCSQAMGHPFPPLIAATLRIVGFALLLAVWNRYAGLDAVAVFWCALGGLVLESGATTTILLRMARSTRTWRPLASPVRPA